MSLACDLMDQGIWPVHAHTDSLIAGGQLQAGLPIGQSLGDWKVEGENCRFSIHGNGWYDFEGERSRMSGVDRNQWEPIEDMSERIAENEKRYRRDRDMDTDVEVPDRGWYAFNQPLEKCKPPTEAHRWLQTMYNWDE